MKRLKTLIVGSCLSAQLALACPHDQYRACLLPRPWGGCAQWGCLPKANNPLEELQNAINDQAFVLAISARDAETARDRADCQMIVAAGLAAWGTYVGGGVGAAVGGAAGIAAASLACRKAFPLEWEEEQ